MINQDQQDFKTIGTNLRGGFRVLSVGGVAFVQPLPGLLTGDQVAALRGAAEVAGLGRRRVAEAIVAQVQRELGVSPDLHALAIDMAAGVVAKEQRDLRLRKANAGRRQIVEATKAVAEPDPCEAVCEALVEVDACLEALRVARSEDRRIRDRLLQLRKGKRKIPELLAMDANRARTATWAALAMVRVRSARASALRREQLDGFWADHANQETARLGAARGEEVGQIDRADLIGRMPGQPHVKPIRISSRDGLAELFESRRLTAHQYGAGRAYRTAYEMAGVIRIANLNPSGGGGGRSHGGLAARSAAELQKSYILARLTQIELAVEGLKNGARALNALRAVAGEGHTIRALGGGGKAREANSKALVAALEAAVQILAAPVHRGLKKSAAS